MIVRWGVHFEFNQPYKQIWDFKQHVSLACLTVGMLSNPWYTKETDDPNWMQPLPIRQIELPEVH